MKNGIEIGIDCGRNACPARCPDNQPCGFPTDCESGRCEDDKCASCEDGRRSGEETGVDCGGNICEDCRLGATCDWNGDCADGICEDGHCCAPNACGLTCGPLPVDGCNGVDDDCNGITDDGDLGTPPMCDEQRGVCAGTISECIAGAWTCPIQMFFAVVPGFERVELSCDALDNDCDGQTDEDCVCPDTPGCEPPPPGTVINELFYDAVGADDDVFIELRGEPGKSLAGWRIEGVNGDTGTVYRTINLSGLIPGNGLYLIVTSNASAELKAKAQLIANVDFQNGPDGVTLRDADGAVADSLAYTDFEELVDGAGEGLEAYTTDPGMSLNRMNGIDTNNNDDDFHSAVPTPGAENL